MARKSSAFPLFYKRTSSSYPSPTTFLSSFVSHHHHHHHHHHRRLLLPRRLLISPFMSRSHQSEPLFIHKGFFYSLAAMFLAVAVYFVFDYLAGRFFRPFRQQSQQPSNRHYNKREDLSMIDLRVIPVKVYFAPPQPSDGDDNDMEAENCPVCLGEYVAGEELRVLPICRHTFHRECIDRWLVTKSSSSSLSSFSSTTSCPVCRGSIVDPEMASTSVASAAEERSAAEVGTNVYV